MFLVMVYIFLAVAVVASVSTAVMSGFRMTNSLDATRKALEAAEYGEAQAVAGLGAGTEADLGLAAWRKAHAQAAPTPAKPRQYPAFGEPGVAPLTLAAVPGVEYVAMAEPLESQELVIVYAAGRCGNAERRVEAIYRPVNAEQDKPSKRLNRIAWRELPPSR